MPAGLDVRRFEPAAGRGARRARARALGGREIAFSFTARHQAANAVAALTVCEALGVPLPDGVVEVAFSRWRSQETRAARRRPADQRRVEREPGRDAGRARASRATAPRVAARSRSSARWRSSATTRRATTRRSARERASTSSSASASLRAATSRTSGPPTRPRRRSSSRELVQPGDAVLVKGSRSVGLEVVAEALAGVAARDPSPDRRARRADRLDPRSARASSRSCARTSSASTSARRGRSITSRKQGTPTMGGLHDPVRGDGRLPAGDALHAAGADRALRDARVRRDRLPRRLHQADAPALARALGPLEDAAARRRRGRRQHRRAITCRSSTASTCRSPTSTIPLSYAWYPFLFLDDRGRGERHESRRRRRRARGGHRDHRASSRSRR